MDVLKVEFDTVDAAISAMGDYEDVKRVRFDNCVLLLSTMHNCNRVKYVTLANNGKIVTCTKNEQTTLLTLGSTQCN
jgi:hypothetical protein